MFILLLLIPLSLSPCFAATNLDSLLERTPGAAAFPQASALIVFDHTHLRLDAEGFRHERRETLYKILDDKAVGSFGKQLLRLDSERDTLLIEAMRWRSADGQWTELGSDNIILSIVPEARWASAYARLKEIRVSFTGIGAGSALHLVYRIEPRIGSVPPASPHAGDVVLFGGYQPIGEKTYEIEVANDHSIFYEMTNEEFEPQISQNDTCTTYRWIQTDLLPIIPEPNTADLSFLVPQLSWTTFSDWEALGLFVSEYFWEKVDSSLDAVDGWAEITSPELQGIPALMNAAYFVLRNIRSVEIPLGEIGCKPNAADHIWENRYANALDKTVLLTAIMRAYGYGPIPVLVPGKPGTFSQLPVLEQFQHVILAVPTGDDTLWFDSMARDFPPGTLPHADTYGRGCLLVGGAPLLLSVPPTRQKINTEFQTSLTDEGTLQGTVTYSSQGDFAARLRTNLAGLNAGELDHFAQSTISSMNLEARLTNYRLSNMADLAENVNVTFDFEWPNFVTRKKDQLLLTIPPSPLDTVRACLSSLSSMVKYPIQLPPPCRTIREFSLTVPEDYRIASIPPTLLIDNPYIRIEIITRLRETILNWTETIEIKRDFVPVTEYPTVYDAVRTSMLRQYQQIILETE